jgi:hypothetical protein
MSALTTELVELTDDQIREAFSLIREGSSTRIHPLIDAAEEVLFSERASRQANAELAAGYRSEYRERLALRTAYPAARSHLRSV